MYNITAEPSDGIRRPMGVEQAEERAREDRIIEERQIQNAKVLAEFAAVEGELERIQRARIAYGKPVPNPATCPHDDITVFQDDRDGSDVETIYGACCACAAWIVSTIWLNSESVETRRMTPAEIEQFAAREDRRRREEWRDECQEND